MTARAVVPPVRDATYVRRQLAPPMERREYLLAGAAAGTALAGCAGALAGAASSAPRDGAAGRERDTPMRVCRKEPRDLGIDEVVDPAFASDWDGWAIEGQYGVLGDDAVVVGVERDGRARAYPLGVLWQHEVVNDDLGGPLIATYCPLCRSGLVAERRVDGEPTVFRVTGLLWRPDLDESEAAQADGRVFGADRDGTARVRTRGNLVMVDDATGSYWSQLLAEAICGPETGHTLGILPSTVATWGAWQADHPDTDVLLPPPHSATA